MDANSVVAIRAASTNCTSQSTMWNVNESSKYYTIYKVNSYTIQGDGYKDDTFLSSCCPEIFNLGVVQLTFFISAKKIRCRPVFLQKN